MNKTVIATEKSPAAIGPYSQAIEVNGMIYTSGVIGVDPKTGEAGVCWKMPEAAWIRR